MASQGIICGMEQMIPLLVDLHVASKFYRGLAEPSRLAILTRLQEGEQTSGEVAYRTALSLSSASRHLMCLRECGLVESRQEWRRVYYRLAPGVSRLLAQNGEVIASLAGRIAACEHPAMRPGRPDPGASATTPEVALV